MSGMLARQYLSISRKAIRVALVASGSSTTDASSYTFSAVGLGNPATNRYVIVGAFGRRAATITASGLTVGGVTAVNNVTNDVDTGGGGGSTCALSIWTANVPSGTTGDIVVTFNNTALRCGYAAYVVYGMGSTAAYGTGTAGTNAGSSDTLNSTVNVPGGGVIIGVAANGAALTAATVWTAMYMDVDTTLESSNGFSAAHFGPATPQLLRATQCKFTATGGTDQTMCLASFAPA